MAAPTSSYARSPRSASRPRPRVSYPTGSPPSVFPPAWHPPTLHLLPSPDWHTSNLAFRHVSDRWILLAVVEVLGVDVLPRSLYGVGRASSSLRATRERIDASDGERQRTSKRVPRMLLTAFFSTSHTLAWLDRSTGCHDFFLCDRGRGERRVDDEHVFDLSNLITVDIHVQITTTHLERLFPVLRRGD